jgi:hypothetical protein
LAWTTPRTWSDGELDTAALMNPHLRDNLRVVPHLIARKTSDQSVTSSTVLVNDTALLAPVLANEVWFLSWQLLWMGTQVSGDIDVVFTFPTGGAIAHAAIWELASSNNKDALRWDATTSPTARNTPNSKGTGVVQSTTIEGIYTNGANAGNVQLQFSQNVSNATATTIKTHSMLMGTKLN